MLPRVCHQQGLPWLYGDVSLILFPVYRTHDKRGLRAASAVWSPAFYSQFVTSVWTRACTWDPR